MVKLPASSPLSSRAVIRRSTMDLDTIIQTAARELKALLGDLSHEEIYTRCLFLAKLYKVTGTLHAHRFMPRWPACTVCACESCLVKVTLSCAGRDANREGILLQLERLMMLEVTNDDVALKAKAKIHLAEFRKEDMSAKQTQIINTIALSEPRARGRIMSGHYWSCLSDTLLHNRGLRCAILFAAPSRSRVVSLKLGIDSCNEALEDRKSVV